MELVSPVAPDIYQVRIPIPFPLRNVQCYMVREADGWTMIDTGLNHATSLEGWEHAFGVLQTGPRDIRQILLTHAHPDHYGLAGHFQNLSGAPVYALDKEIEIIPIEWPEESAAIPTLEHFFRQHGAPHEALERVALRSRQVLHMVHPQPVLSALHEGEEIMIGGQNYRVVWVRGHADGQAIFHRISDGLMFIGDQVLMKITPNIALWPGLDPNPLNSYLASLDKVRGLHSPLALPGHRALIQDLPGRIDEIKHHHGLRLHDCWQAAGSGCTGYAVCRVIFPHLQTVDDTRLGMVEALSHLEYLAFEGRLERLEGDPVCYRQVNGSETLYAVEPAKERAPELFDSE